MKNIVLILLDQMRKDIACHERYPHLPLPHLDALRAEGITCDNTFAQCPTCIPSRASLLTGQYPNQLGVFHHRHSMPDEVETLPERLVARGYDAVAFGKTHRQCKGYRHFPERAGVEGFGSPNGGFHPGQGPIVGVFPGPIEDQHDMAACRQFDAYLDAAEGPFVAHVGIMAPHPPLFPPREFAGRFPRDQVVMPARGSEESAPHIHRHLSRELWLCHSEDMRREMIGMYLDMVVYADYCIGAVIGSLERRGLLDETVVVVTSDHGEMLGEHGQIGKWFSLYDDTLRVPMVFRLPGAKHAGLRLSQDIELVDLAPTLLDLAEVDPPEGGWVGFSGKSFVGLFSSPDDPHRSHVVAMTEHAWAIRTPAYKLVVGAERACNGYSRDLFSDSENQLFSLKDDPGETINLHQSECHSATRADLAEKLIQHLIVHRYGNW